MSWWWAIAFVGFGFGTGFLIGWACLGVLLVQHEEMDRREKDAREES
jgi:hypothetical protein